jgi:hypothetical protein
MYKDGKAAKTVRQRHYEEAQNVCPSADCTEVWIWVSTYNVRKNELSECRASENRELNVLQSDRKTASREKYTV